MEWFERFADYGFAGLMSGAVLVGGWRVFVWARTELVGVLERNTTALAQVAEVMRGCVRVAGRGGVS